MNGESIPDLKYSSLRFRDSICNLCTTTVEINHNGGTACKLDDASCCLTFMLSDGGTS